VQFRKNTLCLCIWLFAALIIGCGGGATAPAITLQPSSVTVSADQQAIFLVTATGKPPLSYQWSKNGTPISGATTASYSLSATAADSGASFRVAITNSIGGVNSKIATLTVNTTTASYNTSFSVTEDPIGEQGNWINGKTVGLDWTDVKTRPGLAFGTESGSGGYDDATAVLAGTWNSDQMAQGTVYTVRQNSSIHEEIELRLRTTITPHSITGYEIDFRCTSDGSQYVEIVRWNGPFGDFGYVATKKGPGLRNGDTIKATVIGSRIAVYINGTRVLQGTDTTYTNGSPGMGFFLQGSGNTADYGLTNFSAANII
jgi:immunoglobulin I-set domain protein